MKITINRVIMLLQAICLLGGQQIMAMNASLLDEIKNNKISKKLVSEKIEVEADKRTEVAKKSNISNNIPKPPVPPKSPIQVKIVPIEKAPLDHDKLQKAMKENALFNKRKHAVEKQDKQDTLEAAKSELNRLKESLEHFKDAQLKNKVKKPYEIKNFESQKAKYKAAIKDAQEKVYLLSPSYKERLEDLYEQATPYTKVIGQKMTGSVQYAKNVKQEVQHSSLFNNPLVNTISALGKTIYNTVTASVQQVKTATREVSDLFGPNMQYNFFAPYAQAQDEDNVILSDDLGKAVVGNDDIAVTVPSNNAQQVRAIQAVIELLVAQEKIDAATMDDGAIKASINNSLQKYKNIKVLLEKVLSNSFAESKPHVSLVNTLQAIPITERTIETVELHIKTYKEAVVKRFTEWKEQAELSLTKESDKEAIHKVQEACEQYDAIIQMLDDAMTMYGYVFLIDTHLTNLAGVSKTTVDTAIALYKRYCKTLSNYKDVKKEFEEDDVINLVKKEVMDGKVKKTADLIIKMKSLFKKSKGQNISALIDTDLAEASNAVMKYVDTIATLLTVSQLQSPKNYTGGIAIQDYLKPHKTTFKTGCDQLTTTQQSYITAELKNVDTESTVMYAMINQCILYQSLQMIADIDQLHIKLEKDTKTYKRQPVSDKMQDISLDMLTKNRSEGIAELLKTHKSVSKMITYAEKEQVAYADRQAKRKVILDKAYKSLYTSAKIADAIATCIETLVHGDTQATDEDLEKLDFILTDFMQHVESDSERFTTEHRAFIETIAQDAIEDAKQNIKTYIVAGWTVPGVKVKMLVEGLKNTKGSSADALAKRVVGKALNAVRKGFIGTGKAIAAENYHEEIREESAQKTKKAAKYVAENGKKGLVYFGNAIAEDNYHEKARKNIAGAIKAAATEFGKGFVKGVKKTAKLGQKGIALLEEEFENNRARSDKKPKRKNKRLNNNEGFPKIEYDSNNQKSIPLKEDSKEEVEWFEMKDMSNKNSGRKNCNDDEEEIIVVDENNEELPVVQPVQQKTNRKRSESFERIENAAKMSAQVLAVLHEINSEAKKDSNGNNL